MEHLLLCEDPTEYATCSITALPLLAAMALTEESVKGMITEAATRLELDLNERFGTFLVQGQAQVATIERVVASHEGAGEQPEAHQ